MSDINSIVIVGRVTRDGELKYTNGGTALLNFSVAVNRSIPPKDGGEWKNEASFIDVQLWGKAAEQKQAIVTKGKLVGVSGSIRQDRWEKDVQSHSKIYIVAESVQALADPRNGQDNVEHATNKPAQEVRRLSSFPSDERPGMDAINKARKEKQAVLADDFSDDIPF